MSEMESSGQINLLKISSAPLVVKYLTKHCGVPLVSMLVQREAVVMDAGPCPSLEILVGFALPLVQRFLRHNHPALHQRLMSTPLIQSALQGMVCSEVTELHVVCRLGNAGTERVPRDAFWDERNSTFYVKRGFQQDFSLIFVELSRIFFDGRADGGLSEFLTACAWMARAGLDWERFVSFTKGVPDLPPNVPAWSLSSEFNPRLIETMQTESAAATAVFGWDPRQCELLNSRRSRQGRGGSATLDSWPPVPEGGGGEGGDELNVSKTSCGERNTLVDLLTLPVAPRVTTIGLRDSSDGASVSRESFLTGRAALEATSNRLEADPDFHVNRNAVQDHLPVVTPRDADARAQESFMQNRKEQDPRFDRAFVRSVGYRGENMIFNYSTTVSVEWLNENGEAGEQYDIRIHDAAANCTTLVEAFCFLIFFDFFLIVAFPLRSEWSGLTATVVK
eukprot:NODE_894_length_1842_cov_32.600669_g714_i1.p1 GENE.NODE_894_length_1842_cov_32.600669_g714_i1~~NODE_894_length_1842_cov_32.600669_g714_i1.p1  ORF type:complete len:519 (+),score=76.87 NODE_894_length_1842_cov_32.600669_g714_i1:208-1557(+)